MAPSEIPPPADPDTSINPYEVLSLHTEANAAEIKTAYKRLALKHHPDKVSPQDGESAHTAFQRLAFAYAVLSDPRRRARYDATGSTAESLLDDVDPDFSWTDFFRAQFASAVTEDKLDHFKSTYQGSDEEASHVLAAYTKTKGQMGNIFDMVMMSDPLEDEDRFRVIIDAAIARQDVEAYEKYTDEPESKRVARKKRAKTERARHDKASKKEDFAQLSAMIQQKKKNGAESFLDRLEARYVNGEAESGAGKARSRKRKQQAEPTHEPDEAAFAAMAERMKSKKRSKKVEVEDGDDKDDEDGGSDGEDLDGLWADEDEVGGEEEEEGEEQDEVERISQRGRKKTRAVTKDGTEKGEKRKKGKDGKNGAEKIEVEKPAGTNNRAVPKKGVARKRKTVR